MEVEEAAATVKKLVKEVADWREVAESAARNANGLTKIIAGYVEMFPHLAPLASEMASEIAKVSTETDGVPRGAEAVRQVLQDKPDEWFLVSELVERLRSRDWLPDSDNPANAVRTALERLLALEDSDIKKIRQDGKVMYSYRPDDAPTSPPAPAYGGFNEEPF